MAVTTGPAPPVQPDAPEVTRRRRRLAVVVAALLVLALVAPLLIAAGLGWRALVVRSPSMGRAAPVGSLVVVRPVAATELRVGDVITYRPPGERGTSYTHRIVEVDPTGFRTRGDINGAADPWTVTPQMLVGMVTVTVPGLGWILRVAPWLAIGAVVIWSATWPIRAAGTRAALRLAGFCATVTGTLLVLRPVAGYSVLTMAPADGGLLATVVSTGLLPVRVSAAGGGGATLPPGAMTRLLLPVSPDGHVQLASSLGLDAVGWCVLGLVCAMPLLGVLLVGLPAEETRRAT